MTFARSVKEELIHLHISKEEMLAEFSALLHLQGEVTVNNQGITISFQSKNIAITRHFFKLVKTLYNAKMEIMSKKTSFNKNEMVVVINSQTQNIISETSLLDESIGEYDLIIRTAKEKQAYLRGAFLASGSVNSPVKPSYHLEIFTKSKTNAVFIQKLMNQYDLNARIIKRRNGLVIYIKEADAVSGFLKVVGAYESVFKFEDLRIQRDFNNSINRIINCEVANEKKTLNAAKEQLMQIRFIKNYKDVDLLEPALKEIISLREDNPEASLKELSIIYEQVTGDKISKSGINHRLQKIKNLAINIAKNLQENSANSN